MKFRSCLLDLAIITEGSWIYVFEMHWTRRQSDWHLAAGRMIVCSTLVDKLPKKLRASKMSIVDKHIPS